MQNLKIPAEVYSRVVGYIRPVLIGNRKCWNPGKCAEFEDRKTLKIKPSDCDDRIDG